MAMLDYRLGSHPPTFPPALNKRSHYIEIERNRRIQHPTRRPSSLRRQLRQWFIYWSCMPFSAAIFWKTFEKFYHPKTISSIYEKEISTNYAMSALVSTATGHSWAEKKKRTILISLCQYRKDAASTVKHISWYSSNNLRLKNCS